jgi:hypothetical protein
MLRMIEDEVQDREPRFHVFEGVSTPVADVLSANGSIHSLVRELKDARVVLVLLFADVPACNEFGSKPVDDAPWLFGGKLSELALSEVPRMNGYDVKESSFPLRVTEAS